MESLGLILLSTGLISLGALAGVVTLWMNQEKVERCLLFLVALSTGVLMGGAFLHLLPEAVERVGSEVGFLVVLGAFMGFFLIEKILHWHHCHKGDCDEHVLGQMNLIGDSVHNFIDGLIIAAAFGVDVKLGWVTSLAVALHEIPQEISDFGVLLYAGWEKSKALVANFLVALMVVLGGLAGYWLSVNEMFIGYLMPVAAGGFIYIAASDLMPELKKEAKLKKSLVSFGVFGLGVLLMWMIR
jgi:zinc and cadmium transporter